MRISDWSSDVCSSDLPRVDNDPAARRQGVTAPPLIGSRGPELPDNPNRDDLGAAARPRAQVKTPGSCRAWPSRHMEPRRTFGSAGFSMGIKVPRPCGRGGSRSEEHTSELQSLMRNSYAVFCLKKKKYKHNI